MRQREEGIQRDRNKTKDRDKETGHKRQKDEVMYKNARYKGQRVLNYKPKYK